MSTKLFILSMFLLVTIVRLFGSLRNEIKITHYEKIFSRIKQKFSHFGKGFGKKTFFCLTKITIIFTDIHRIKTKPKNNYQNI